MECQKAIFIEYQDSVLVQVKDDIGVIIEIVMDPDKKDGSQYMVFWLYRKFKVVWAFETDTHHGPVDEFNYCYVHNEEFDDDWWQRRPGWEIPPSGISLDYFVEPHTGNIFSRGDCIMVEQNYVTSKFHHNMVDVNFGDRYVLLDYKYEPNQCYGKIQKHYFIMFSYNEKEIVLVLEGYFCHAKDDFRNKSSNVLKNLL